MQLIKVLVDHKGTKQDSSSLKPGLFTEALSEGNSPG